MSRADDLNAAFRLHNSGRITHQRLMELMDFHNACHTRRVEEKKHVS